jgi:hypothetical protein
MKGDTVIVSIVAGLYLASVRPVLNLYEFYHFVEAYVPDVAMLIASRLHLLLHYLNLVNVDTGPSEVCM